MHDPVKHIKIKINCYSWTAKHLAYKSTFSKNDKIKHTNVWQCHYCSNYYGQKDKYDRHLEHWSRITEIIYNFDSQNIVNFGDK